MEPSHVKPPNVNLYGCFTEPLKESRTVSRMGKRYYVNIKQALYIKYRCLTPLFPVLMPPCMLKSWGKPQMTKRGENVMRRALLQSQSTSPPLSLSLSLSLSLFTAKCPYKTWRERPYSGFRARRPCHLFFHIISTRSHPTKCASRRNMISSRERFQFLEMKLIHIPRHSSRG